MQCPRSIELVFYEAKFVIFYNLIEKKKKLTILSFRHKMANARAFHRHPGVRTYYTPHTYIHTDAHLDTNTNSPLGILYLE